MSADAPRPAPAPSGGRGPTSAGDGRDAAEAEQRAGVRERAGVQDRAGVQERPEAEQRPAAEQRAAAWQRAEAQESATYRSARRRGGRSGLLAVVLLAAAIAVVAAAGYGALYALAFDKVPRNTTMAGVDLGGASYQQASDRIRAATAAVASRPVALTGSGVTGTVVPAAAGLTVDVRASVVVAAPVTSRDPRDLLNGLIAGPRRLDPVLGVDRVKLAAALAPVAKAYSRPVREGSVQLVGSRPQSVLPQPGQALDVARTAAAVIRSVERAEPTATVVTAVLSPRTTAAQVNQVVRGIVPKLLSGPIALRAGGRTARLSTALLGDHTSFTAQGSAGTAGNTSSAGITSSALVLREDAAGLRAQSPNPLAPLESPARDAGFTVSGVTAAVRPEVDGVAVSAADLSAAVAQAGAATGGGRSVPVATTITRPRVTTAALQALGVQQVTGAFTGTYSYAPGLATNLGRAAARLNGQTVAAGATLSLNHLLGQRTRAAGYVDGPVLRGNRYDSDVGGGVGTAATVLYDAVYAAGWGIVAHTPERVWSGSGPPGRDATISWPGIDLVVRNDTPAPAYLQAELVAASPFSPGTMTVRVLSRPWWTVGGGASGRSAVVARSTVIDDSPSCLPRPGSDGFTITDRRIRSHPGADREYYVFITHYRPSPAVVCPALAPPPPPPSAPTSRPAPVPSPPPARG